MPIFIQLLKFLYLFDELFTKLTGELSRKQQSTMGKKIWLSLYARNFCWQKNARPPIYVNRCQMSYTGITNCVRLDIRHLCYDNLRAVKIGYPLTSVTSLYRGLRLTNHWGDMFFNVLRWPVVTWKRFQAKNNLLQKEISQKFPRQLRF